MFSGHVIRLLGVLSLGPGTAPQCSAKGLAACRHTRPLCRDSGEGTPAPPLRSPTALCSGASAPEPHGGIPLPPGPSMRALHRPEAEVQTDLGRILSGEGSPRHVGCRGPERVHENGTSCFSSSEARRSCMAGQRRTARRHSFAGWRDRAGWEAAARVT